MKSPFRLLPAFCILLFFTGCGGGSGGTTPVYPTTPTVTVTPASSSITTAQSFTVSITVSGASGAATGSVLLSSGSYASSATALSSGSAAITIPAESLAVGSDTLTAKYTPDSAGSSTYNSASGTASVTVASASSNTITLQLPTLTLTATEYSSVSSNVTLTRAGSTGSVTFSVAGLPSGATVSFLHPGTGNSGEIVLIAGPTVSAGTYPITLQASDGTNSGTARFNLVIDAAIQPADPYAWSSTGPLISAIPDATHPILSVKDPTAVFYKNQWNVYATTADSNGGWSMVYLNFPDWSSASTAKPYYIDENPNLAGYHCAPELFYFSPQNKWYLIYQSGPPQYSTADDPTQPSTWTAPQSFFSSQPSSVSNWLDFWVICDTANCYLFFSDDGGNFFRSQTTVANFPNGFSTPQIIMQAPSAGDLFEASRVYSLKGSTQYLAIIECMGGPSGHRYFRAFVADSLDGIWTPVSGAGDFAAPFLGSNDVTFASGVTLWTNDFSHGEILRTGEDELLQIDPANMQFLYQGVNPTANAPSYSAIPWQLGLATTTSY